MSKEDETEQKSESESDNEDEQNINKLTKQAKKDSSTLDLDAPINIKNPETLQDVELNKQCETNSETQQCSNKHQKDEKDIKKIMIADFSYPNQEDVHLQYKLFKKREFYRNKMPERHVPTDYPSIVEYRENVCERPFRLRDHQVLLSNFINPDTPYRGVLVFHGLGSGKTCASIAIAEKFKQQVMKYGTKIVILVVGPLNKEAWKKAVVQCTGDTYMKSSGEIYSEEEKEKQQKQAFNNTLQYYRFMTFRSFYKKVLGQKIVEKKVVKGTKTKVSYRKTEEGEFERDVSGDKIHSLDNTLLIIDEAHNLTNNNYGDAVMQIIKNSQNLKVVLLTGTPMKNLPDDIISLLNFLRPPDNPIEREHIFTSEKNHEMDLKEGAMEYFKNMARGYISYLRSGDPLIFPKRVDLGVLRSGLLFTKVISCKMEPFQQQTYDSVVKENDPLDRLTESVANFVFPGLSADKSGITKYYGVDGLVTIKNQIKTNSELLNKKIATDLLKAPERPDYLYLSESEKTITGKILHIDHLKTFSTKFHQALININELVYGKKGPHTAFVYSNLVRIGIEIFEEVLKQNGYLEFQESKIYKMKPETVCYYCGKQFKEHNKSAGLPKDIPDHNFHPATYITVTGKSTEESAEYLPEEKQKIFDNVFNKLSNVEGKYLKLILGSKVMNEGINLKQVAEVHILDVHFNLGKVDQVVGRAIRNCSHIKVANENNVYPEVKVYKYCVILDNGMSSEEKLYKNAEDKYMTIKKLERWMQEVAIDCPLNMHGNIFKEEVEKYKNCGKEGEEPCPVECNYQSCVYKCEDEKLNREFYDPSRNLYKNIPGDILDFTTFSHNLAKNEIDNAKTNIKEMFSRKFVYTLDDILEKIDSYSTKIDEKIDPFFVLRALNDMIPVTENDFNNFTDIVYDKYNRPGYLIYRNKYYIFQPFDKNEDAPMYYRTSFASSLKHSVSLYSYLKTKPEYKKYKETVKSKKLEQTKSAKSYDFESVMEYYDSREEFEFVGIIDKIEEHKKLTQAEDNSDVFKIRERRSKILEKKRGTGIPSLKGAVCSNAKSREYLDKILAKLKLSAGENEFRISICEKIKNALLLLEKYATTKDKNKMTYVMIPKNHPTFEFPYNLEDRVQHIINKLKSETKKPLETSVKTDKKKSGPEKGYPSYVITIKDFAGSEEFKNVFEQHKATKVGNNWTIVVE